MRATVCDETMVHAPSFCPADVVLADVRLTLDGVRLPFAVLGNAVESHAVLRDAVEGDAVESHAVLRNAVEGDAVERMPAPGRVRLAVPAELIEAALVAGQLVVTDTRSTPLAILSDLTYDDLPDDAPFTGCLIEGGLIEGTLRPAAHEPQPGQPKPSGTQAGDRHLAPAEVPRRRDARLVVVMTRPLSDADLKQLDADANEVDAEILLVVPTGGPSPDGVPAQVLLRCADQVVSSPTVDLGVPVTVVTTPLRWRASARDSVTVALTVAVADAYEASAVMQQPQSAEWNSLLEGLADGTAVDSGDAALSAALPVLLEWRPPRSKRGLVVFFTGLSGSGKSTLAELLVEHLTEHTSRTVTLLDGDEVRRMLSAGLGFSREDRDLNVRRIGYVAAEIARHGGIAICAPIAPYAESRAAVREMVSAGGDLLLVHVATPLEECERRDAKGLYAKARAGLVSQFTGISDPYDEPDDADLRLDTSQLDRQRSLRLVVDRLEAGGWIPAPPR
ncbi:MAG TPA: adenylyl-sulfate kinase [Kribbella sp.]